MKRILFFTFLMLCFFSANAFSAVRTWSGNGTDTNWGTPANWVEGVVPVAGDSLIFPAAATQYTSNDNQLFVSVYNSITIEGGNYTITGGFLPKRLQAGITVNGGTHAINKAIQTELNQTFTAAQGSTTTIALLVVGSDGLTLNGAGSFGFGIISGQGSIIKNGAGAGLIAAAQSFTGGLTLNEGILVVDANVPNSAVTINGGAIGGGEFGFSGFGGTGTVGATNVTAGVISAGTLTSPTGILNINNGLTFTANGIYACKIGGATAGANGYDQLNIAGTVTLSNALLVPIPLEPFVPATGDSFTIIKNDGTDAVNGTFLNLPEGAVFTDEFSLTFRISYRGGDGNDVIITRVGSADFDFDGDGKSDVSVFRPSNGTWYLQQSTAGFTGFAFGANGDAITPADYDGDGKTDVAVFRPSNGTWYLQRSTAGFTGIAFGASGDIPMPTDFDGDGKADLAVFRPSNGVWYIQQSTAGFVGVSFGTSGDVPAAADYDGDGKADVAVFRPSNGVWYLNRSQMGFTGIAFGTNGDKAVPSDYDGDDKADIAVFRPSNGTWYLQQSSAGFNGIVFGANGDLPVPADYDGDGKADVSVFRSSNGTWYLNRTTQGFTGVLFGANGDKPIPNAFIP